MKNELYPKLLVFLQFALIAAIVYVSHLVINLLPILIFLLGAVLGIWALSHNKLGNFNIQPKLKEGCHLVTTGIYRWIRHPMYASVILMMLGFVLNDLSFLGFSFLLMLVFVLYLKALREEKLWCGHNEAYLDYKKRTKLFIPYIL